MKKEEYLNIVESQIRCKMARGAVNEEIRSHIEDQAEAFRRDGMEPEAAEAAAVKEMGDPVEIGEALNRIHRPQMAWGMIGLITALSVLGLVLQYFLRIKLGEDVGTASGMAKQAAFQAMGLGVMIGVCFLDYSRIGCYAREITAVLLILLALGMRFSGTLINGSSAWIYVGGVSMNVKLILLLLVPLYGAILYSYRGQGYGAVGKGVLWMLPGIMIARRCSSVLSILILLLSFLTLLGLAVYWNWFRVSRRGTLSVLGAAAAGLPLAGYGWMMRFGAAYQQARMKALLDPGEAPSAQLQAIRELLGESRMIGGLQGARQMEGLKTSDFMITYLMSYYGILAAILVMGLIALLIVKFCRISLRQKNRLGMMMGIGSCVVLLIQILFYAMSNLGSDWSMLFAGGYCPFLTFGGSGTMVTAILFGLLLSIYRYQNVLPEPKQKRPRRFLSKAEC